MDSGVLVAAVMAFSAVIVATVSGMYTYRASRKNSEATRSIEQDRLSTDSWERQVKAWREDVVALRAQRAEDTRLFEDYRKASTALISDLEVRIRETRHQISLLASWIKIVLPLLQEHDISFPPLPDGIVEE